MNDRVLTLIHYLLGNSCVLSSLSSHFKGPGEQPLPLHSDNGNGIPAPFPRGRWSPTATTRSPTTRWTPVRWRSSPVRTPSDATRPGERRTCTAT